MRLQNQTKCDSALGDDLERTGSDEVLGEPDKDRRNKSADYSYHGSTNAYYERQDLHDFPKIYRALSSTHRQLRSD